MAKQGGSGGGGVVLRDYHGIFVAGACHFFLATTDPEVAELLACCRGVLLAQENDVQKVVFEMDSLNAVRKINNIQKDLSMMGQVVQEIKELLTQFQEVRVVWVRRSANVVTHRLDRESCCRELCHSWRLVVPDFVSSDIASDGALEH